MPGIRGEIVGKITKMAPVFLRIRSLTVDSPGGILYINYSYLRVEVSLSFENNEGYPSFVLIQHENKPRSGTNR